MSHTLDVRHDRREDPTRLGQPRTTPGEGYPRVTPPGRPTPSLPTSPWSIRFIPLFSFVIRMDKTEEDRGRPDLQRKSRRRVDLPLAGLCLGHAALTTRVVLPASLLPLLLPAHDSRSPPSSPPHRPCLCAPLSFSQDNGAPRGDLPPRSGDRPSGSGFPAAAAPTTGRVSPDPTLSPVFSFSSLHTPSSAILVNTTPRAGVVNFSLPRHHHDCRGTRGEASDGST